MVMYDKYIPLNDICYVKHTPLNDICYVKHTPLNDICYELVICHDVEWYKRMDNVLLPKLNDDINICLL